MRAIIVSEVTLETNRKLLIEKLSQVAREREQKIKTGNLTGMTADPKSSIEYYVCQTFESIVKG